MSLFAGAQINKYQYWIFNDGAMIKPALTVSQINYYTPLTGSQLLTGFVGNPPGGGHSQGVVYNLSIDSSAHDTSGAIMYFGNASPFNGDTTHYIFVVGSSNTSHVFSEFSVQNYAVGFNNYGVKYALSLNSDSNELLIFDQHQPTTSGYAEWFNVNSSLYRVLLGDNKRWHHGTTLSVDDSLVNITATSEGSFIVNDTNNNVVLTAQKGGTVGINTASPGATLDVNGKTKTGTFQLTTGGSNNYVMVSDGSGNGTWQVNTWAQLDSVSIYALTPAKPIQYYCTNCTGNGFTGHVIAYIGSAWRRLSGW